MSHSFQIDTANTLKLVNRPQALTAAFPEYEKLQACGREWQIIQLAEMATGLVRVGTFETMRGRFLTNITPTSSGEAQKLLELAIANNPATHACKVDAPVGTVILAGLMTSSATMQFYVPDTSNLIYRDTTKIY